MRLATTFQRGFSQPFCARAAPVTRLERSTNPNLGWPKQVWTQDLLSPARRTLPSALLGEKVPDGVLGNGHPVQPSRALLKAPKAGQSLSSTSSPSPGGPVGGAGETAPSWRLAELEEELRTARSELQALQKQREEERQQLEATQRSLESRLEELQLSTKAPERSRSSGSRGPEPAPVGQGLTQSGLSLTAEELERLIQDRVQSQLMALVKGSGTFELKVVEPPGSTSSSQAQRAPVESALATLAAAWSKTPEVLPAVAASPATALPASSSAGPMGNAEACRSSQSMEATQPSAPSAPVAVEPSTQPEVDVAAYVPPADEDGQADTPEEVGREAEARSADESETAEEAASNSAWLSTAAPQPSRMMTEVASSDDSPEEVDGLASEDDLQLDAIPAGGLEEAASTAAPYPAFSEQEAEGSDSAWVSTAAQYPAASNGEREEASAAEQEVCSGGDEAETASAASAQPAPEEVGDQSAWPQQAFAEGQQVDWPDEASDAQQAADASLWEEEASAKGEQEGWPDQTLADGQKEEGSAVRHEADCPDETPADTQKAADASLREEEASAKGEQEEGAALRDEVDWPDETPQKVDAPSGQEETSEAEQVDWPNEASVDAQQVDWPDEASADAQQVDWPDEASAEGQTEQASDAAVWPPEAGSSLAWPDASERTRQADAPPAWPEASEKMQQAGNVYAWPQPSPAKPEADAPPSWPKAEPMQQAKDAHAWPQPSLATQEVREIRQDTDAWQAPVRELQRRVAKLEDQLMALQPPEASPNSVRPQTSKREAVRLPEEVAHQRSQQAEMSDGDEVGRDALPGSPQLARAQWQLQQAAQRRAV
ncbi:unnamed protein product [Durusdinium trenchii]|uniref:Uncharacterized protein n=1 Tax=Durusdinium trenchii TaxID=1381693 RepID=A0ABP0PVX4_9DINO